jgi:hypothetical protein
MENGGAGRMLGGLKFYRSNSLKDFAVIDEIR